MLKIIIQLTYQRQILILLLDMANLSILEDIDWLLLEMVGSIHEDPANFLSYKLIIRPE